MKGSDKLNDGSKTSVREIDGNTHILFTVKTFFAFIGAILGIFFGFYQMVITPKVEAIEKNNSEFTKEVTTEIKQQNVLMYQEFETINRSILGLQSTLEIHITATNKNFNKYNRSTLNYITPIMEPTQNVDTLNLYAKYIQESKD